MNITSVFKCSQEEFDNIKTKDMVPLECTDCNKTYYRMKRYIVNHIRDYNRYPTTCASCKPTSKSLISCEHCSIKFQKENSEIKRYKHHFCSQSCSASWNNKNKTYGTRRSKLEVYLEEQLTTLYSTLYIEYSNKQVIGSELDIYIPSLKLAFEIQRDLSLRTYIRSRKIRSN